MDCSLLGSSVHGVSKEEYWSGLPFPSPGDSFPERRNSAAVLPFLKYLPIGSCRIKRRFLVWFWENSWFTVLTQLNVQKTSRLKSKFWMRMSAVHPNYNKDLVLVPASTCKDLIGTEKGQMDLEIILLTHSQEFISFSPFVFSIVHENSFFGGRKT